MMTYTRHLMTSQSRHASLLCVRISIFHVDVCQLHISITTCPILTYDMVRLEYGIYRSLWLIGWLVGWLVGQLTKSCLQQQDVTDVEFADGCDWFRDWLMGGWNYWLVGWLVSWLIGWLIDWWIDSHNHSSSSQLSASHRFSLRRRFDWVVETALKTTCIVWRRALFSLGCQRYIWAIQWQ